MKSNRRKMVKIERTLPLSYTGTLPLSYNFCRGTLPLSYTGPYHFHTQAKTTLQIVSMRVWWQIGRKTDSVRRLLLKQDSVFVKPHGTNRRDGFDSKQFSTKYRTRDMLQDSDRKSRGLPAEKHGQRSASAAKTKMENRRRRQRNSRSSSSRDCF